jgi:flagellar basal body-associated protein FliL
MTAPAEPDAKGGSAPPARKRSLLLVIAAALAVVLLGGGASAWFFFFRTAGQRDEKKEASAKPPAHILKAGTLIVNIAGTEGRRYLRTTLELGLGPKEVKHVEELKPVLLDAANGVLGAKPLAQLLEPAERDTLKDELKQRLNAVLGKPKVITHVLLTEFVIQ